MPSYDGELTLSAYPAQASRHQDRAVANAPAYLKECYRRDYLRTTVGAPARIFGDDFSLGD
jgi:hypothetical protein